MEKNEKDKYLSNSLVRGLEILKMFTPENPTYSLAEISQNLGVSRTVPYRFLYTLQTLGYLYQDEVTKRYGLTPKVLELGYSYLNTLQLPDIAKPYMEELRDHTKFSTHLGLLEGHEVVYVSRVPNIGVTTVTINIGSRLPAHATAMGKCLLSYLTEEQLYAKFAGVELKQFTQRTKTLPKDLLSELEEIKEKGYAISDGEFEAEIRSVAAPIVKNNQVIAAINIAAPKAELREENLESIIQEVVHCATQISKISSYSFSIT
ncbi:IclR family transcriptional regulator [Bacillus sp. FJAT-45350]|uniref:IclR family transcriptional regulator n=1 Tax=Bacillus sp. FJAT-45350 TaxID=2011014 RepID=UPI000BB82DBD|nr:IclR family transcriptional regulator [Bacillus sp. FJAT-45350]